MSLSCGFTRRSMLQRIALGLSLGATLTPAARCAAPALPQLLESDPDAKAVSYVTDASRSKQAASSGASCANCSLFSALGEADGACTLFKGKAVKAAGWCSAWSGL